MNVCLFDIDGTLLSSGGAGKAALETAFTEDFGVTIRHHVPYAGRTDRAIQRDLLRLHGIEYTLANTSKLTAGYLARLPNSLVKHDGRVLPGIVPLLEWLRSTGRFAIGLLTGNIHAGAKVKLGHYGLFDHFAFGGFGDLHYERDDVAREARTRIYERVSPQVPGDKIWVIGDTPLDVQCARAIGAKVVAVATGHHTVAQLEETKADVTLADLSDWKRLTEIWV